MILVKIGGGENINLEAIITDLAKQKSPFIIVHGASVWLSTGGPITGPGPGTRLMTPSGIPASFRTCMM